MLYYELPSELGLQGKNPDEIADGIEAAYAKGELPRIGTVSFAYMWSADKDLGPGIGHWHPHMMVFNPYYENSMLGGNEFGGSCLSYQTMPVPVCSDRNPYGRRVGLRCGEVDCAASTAIFFPFF